MAAKLVRSLTVNQGSDLEPTSWRCWRSVGTRTIAVLTLLGAMIATSSSASAQFIQQGEKLVGSNFANAARQGWSIALSQDGNTAIVGGPFDNQAVGTPFAFGGAAWVFTRSGGVWSQQGPKLVGTGAASGNSEQGFAVALSGDGNTAVLGAPFDAGVGGVWIFTRSGGTWSQQGPKLVGSGAVQNSEEGHSVALSADGTTLIMGAPGDNDGFGAAWVFKQSGGVWIQQTKLIGTGAVGVTPEQGYSVALSADGTTAMVGGPEDNDGLGAAWIFKSDDAGVWTQRTKLIGTGALGTIPEQGYSVALSADGSTAIVGGPNDNVSAGATGAAWVFAESGAAWTQQTKLVGTGAVGEAEQGFSVALSSSGATAIVGGPFDDNATQGATWVFSRSGGNWSQQGAKLIGAGGVGQTNQGYSVAISAAGDTLAWGGPNDQNAQGAAWIFAYHYHSKTATHDFNGDSKSDLLWRDASGDVAIWLMSGAKMLQSTEVGGVANTWSVIGQRDFDGDGDADILWRNVSGDLAMWFVTGLNVVPGPSIASVPTNWGVYGTGDLDGDGKGDILWRDMAGNVAIWFMNGSQVSATAGLGQVPTDWTILGDDNWGNIFWRNTSGDIAIWKVNGTQVVTSAVLGNVPNNWIIAGLGDFNGDGITDILWWDPISRTVALWFLNSSGQIGSTAAVVGLIPQNSTWRIQQTGDYNGDGYSDVLLTDGSHYAIWFMNGATISSVAPVATVGATWSVQALNAE